MIHSNIKNKDFIYPLENDPISAGIQVFSSKIYEENRNINWFYTKFYQNNIPQSIEDSRDYHHIFEELIEIYKPWIKKNSMAIDIGAYNGDTTLPISFLIGEQGKVLAFEPHPDNFKELERNVLSNICSNVNLYNFAITLDEQEHDFYYHTGDGQYRNGGLSEWTKAIPNFFNEKIKVKSLNLEKLLKEKYSNWDISFIKTDTEGFDCQILYYIKDIIEKHKPTIIIEWIPGMENPINQILQIINYKSFNPKTLQEIKITRENNIQDIILIPN